MIDQAAARAWQHSWDRQQENYLPHREDAFVALLDVVAAITTKPARVLDLAGGTGSLALRLMRRMPTTQTTLLDIDPVLLEIAAAALPRRVTIVRADLGDPGWTDTLPHGSYHAVLTATAMHCLRPPRLTALYREVREILTPGGVFGNADRMPTGELPSLHARLARGADNAWSDWWRTVSADPALGSVLAQRVDSRSADWYPPAAWHLDALREAGFDETGVLWRRLDQAAVVGIRAGMP